MDSCSQTLLSYWKQHKQGLITVGTAVISAAIMYQILPIIIVAGSICILIAHEYGHYFIGFAGGGTVSSPFFIPLILFTLGGTKIKISNPSAKASTALAGAIAGGLALLMMVLVSLVFIGTVSVSFLFMLLLSELFAVTLGSDGKRYRDAMKGM